MRLLYYLLVGCMALVPCATAAKAGEATFVVASLQPVTGCSDPSSPWLSSGCAVVPKPQDRFYEPCGGKYECPVTYQAKHTNWGPVQTLPPVTVVAPKRALKKGRVVASRSSSGKGERSTGQSNDSASPSIGEQLARQGLVMGSQMGGTALGTLAGGPVGAFIGGWLGCTFSVYGIVQKDFAKKERWDLHPELAQSNFNHSLIVCSVFGFIQRAKEAPTERDRAFALLQGLSLVPYSYVSLVGQLAPAANAMLPKSDAAKTGNGKFLGLWTPSQPYHNGAPWVAYTPG